MSRHLMWFRRDLRVEDNTALYESARAAKDGLVGAFVICAAQWREHDEAPVKIDFWLRSLRALSKSLDIRNIPLVVLSVDSIKEIPARLLSLARKHKCDALYFNREYEMNEARRDEAVCEKFAAAGLATRAFHDRVLFQPSTIRTGQGRFYTVFTPFKKRVLAALEENSIKVLPAPKKMPPSAIKATPVPDSVDGFESSISPSFWKAGEKAVAGLLSQFIDERIGAYKDDRDSPAIDGTSRLSPYLASGAISPRQCLAAAQEANGARWDEKNPGKPGPACWISELIWREFYQHILVGFPRVSMGRAFKPATDRIEWNENPAHFERWSQGRTGVPIIDAAMRQLHTTGWMHNRLRMIVAMYLSKDLFLDWRLGERHFMTHLVDGDLGSNNGGWQWSASTGCDAAPYFRVFNPVSQSKRCDPDGAFIRHWIPELAKVEGAAVHDPSTLPPLQRQRLDYPESLVDRKGVIERVTNAFRAATRSKA